MSRVPGLPDRVSTTVDNPQQSLDDYKLTLGETARDTGLQTAQRSDPEFVETALAWIEDLEPGAETCADDIRRRFGSSAAMGSVFRIAARRRLIAVAGFRTSTAPSRHRGDQKLWRRS